MWIRPHDLTDAGWMGQLGERLFAHLDAGYGAQVARWALDPQVLGWVAEEPEGRVGFLLLGTLGVVDGNTRIAEVLAIGVDASCRRRGVGRALLSQALRHARGDAGVLELRLTTSAEDPAPRALFEQAGFRLVREQDGTFPSGVPALRMVWGGLGRSWKGR